METFLIWTGHCIVKDILSYYSMMTWESSVFSDEPEIDTRIQSMESPGLTRRFVKLSPHFKYIPYSWDALIHQRSLEREFCALDGMYDAYMLLAVF